jgi:predicted metallopeptidase
MPTIKYQYAPDVEEIARDVVSRMNWDHIKLEHIGFLRSLNSKSRGTIARCHAMGKAMQIGLKRNTSFYVIEVISKRYDRFSEKDKVKTVIHELMHIPKSFGGGFKHHNVVNEKSVKNVYEKYEELKKNNWF